LLLARYGKEPPPQRMLPKVSQQMLAEMIGTTRPRVNFFMNKFRKLGFIKYNGGLQINTSLLSGADYTVSARKTFLTRGRSRYASIQTVIVITSKCQTIDGTTGIIR
jgi:hypothetical protein